MARKPSFIVNNLGPDDTFVLVRHRDYGVIAYHFQRDVGSVDPADVGAPFQTWRRTGEWGLDALDANPYGASRKIICNAIGSLEYAFYSAPNNTWGGSYSGGETVISMTGTTLAADGAYNQFSFMRRSIITYDNGDTIDVALKETIHKDGSISEKIHVSSADEFVRQMFGMELGSGAAWTQYSLDSGRHWVNIAAEGHYDLGDRGHVMMRNSMTGQTIDSDSDINKNASFDQAFIVKEATIAKLFYSFDRGTIDGITASRDISFGYAKKNIRVESDQTCVMGKFDKYLTLTGNEAVDARGNGADNVITGNNADNRIVGSSGDDMLRGRRGLDVLTGGQGHDVFKFVAGDGNDIIKDFRHGADTIEFRGLGNFSDLTIAADGANVSLTIDGLEILVLHADAASFGRHDFDF